MDKVLDNIISVAQAAFVKNRTIGQCIRLIDGIMNFTEDTDIEGILLAIDFQKAFDSLEWNFMFKSLQCFNFGPSLLKWVHTFYNNPSSCVMNRGLSTKYFNLTRGVRQGDPLSPILFIISLDLLLVNLQHDNNIHGILIENHEIKSTAYADDLTCFLRDEMSARNLLSLLTKFSVISGLCINIDKTEALWLGKWKHRKDILFGVKWPMSPIKIVGIFFSYNTDAAYKMNLNAPMDGLSNVLNCWKGRFLSLIGRLQIVKTLIIPKFIYILSHINVRQADIKTVNSKIYSFLWKGHDRVARNTMIGDIGQGGLGMLDILAMQKALKLTWVKHYLFSRFHPWKLTFDHYLKNIGGYFIFKCNFSLKSLGKNFPPFLREMLHIWSLVQNEENLLPDSEIIWNNKNILVESKSIFIKDFFKLGIVYIADIFTEEGKIKDWNFFKNCGINRINYIQWQGVISAIPLFLKTYQAVYVRPENTIMVYCNNSSLALHKSSSRQLRNLVSSNYLVHPKSQRFFNDLFEEVLDWDYIYRMPFKVTICSKLREF